MPGSRSTFVGQRFTPSEFKDELVRRLLPTVPRHGKPPPVAIGADFGKFELEGELGKGGMAIVYRALDPERGSGSDHGPASKRSPHVALKVMKDEIALDPAKSPKAIDLKALESSPNAKGYTAAGRPARVEWGRPRGLIGPWSPARTSRA